jgi:integrase
MATRQYRTLSKRIVDRLAVDDKDTVFWDRELPGFGLRVYPSGAKVYVVQTRCGGRSKRVTVGRHGDLSPDQARKEAARVIVRIKAGEEPIPVVPKADPTMAELAERYQREHVAMRCRPATVAHYGIMLAKHIVPALGGLKVAEVERKHILAFHYELREKPTVANRALEMLVKMFNLAEAWDLRPPGKNPCRFVRRYKVQPQHERFITPEELGRLGRALDAAPAERLASRHGAAAIRLLVLTGCRRNEILGLRWDDVNFEAGELRLRDAKTGPRQVSLSPAAVRVLSAIPRHADTPWVISGRKPGTRLGNLNASWLVVRARAGLEDVRIHDLRHSFASRALALGESLAMIGKLLGHRKVQTTARYAHLAQDSAKAAAARVAESLRADMARSGHSVGVT